jgi:hypothetical protein
LANQRFETALGELIVRSTVSDFDWGNISNRVASVRLSLTYDRVSG